MDSETFKTYMTRLGWDASEAAKQFHRSTPTIYKWMQGTRKIPASVATFLISYTPPGATANQKQKQVKPPTLTAAHLVAFRRHFHLAQLEAAALTGVSRVTWNRWENGKAPIPSYMKDVLKRVVEDLKNVA